MLLSLLGEADLLEEVGRVNDVRDGKITVEIDRKSACSSCGMCAMSHESGKMVLELENGIGAVPGDKVVLELPGSSILLASLLAYAVPLVFFIIGIAAGHYIFSREQALALVCGIIFMAAGFFIVKFADKKIGSIGSIKIKARKT